MLKQPTIRDVASAAGVSVAVVSRVLNPGSGPVAPLTREQVLKVIDDLGYHPRTAARELKHQPPTTLGLLLADVANPFFARLADHVVNEADARGIQVLLMTTQEDSQLETQRLTTLLERRVSGIIATPTGENLDFWSKLIKVGTQVVFVDRSIPELPEVDEVRLDNKGSAYAATSHLCAMGHRRIAIISGPDKTTTGRDRIQGYVQALLEAGIARDEELIRSSEFRGTGGADAISALMSLPERPTALVVANTAQVTGVLRRLTHSNVAIPGELSVVVFDDSPWTELITPPLTIIRQPIEMLARHSVTLALATSLRRESAQPARIAVRTELVKRSSVAPVGAMLEPLS